MAHVEKLNAKAVGHMIDHYERTDSAMGRDNIDASRTPLNYEIATLEGTWTNLGNGGGLGGALKKMVERSAAIHKKTTGRAVRSDAVRVADWVVTLPEDCPQERAEEFFTTVLDFARARYGKNAVFGGFVHMDETTPHMHMPVIPLKDGRLCAKELISRQDLKGWHDDLQGYLQFKGVPGTVVDCKGGKRPNIESKLKQSDLKKMDAFINEKTASAVSQSRQDTAFWKQRYEETEKEKQALKTALKASQDKCSALQGEMDALRASINKAKQQPQVKKPQRTGIDTSHLCSPEHDGFSYGV